LVYADNLNLLVNTINKSIEAQLDANKGFDVT